MPSDWWMATTMPPLAVPSSLVSTTPVTSTACLNSCAWRRPFWPVVASSTSRVSCGAPGSCLLDDPAHLLELAHEVDLRVQAAGGVHEHDVGAARARRGHAVEDDGGRVGVGPLLDDLAADTLGPLVELLDGGGAERVAGHHERGLPHLLEAPGDLADGRRLAGAVHADHEDDGRRSDTSMRWRSGSSGRSGLGDHVGELVLERLLGLDLLGRAALLELVDDLDGAVDADVGGDQRLLGLLVESPVDTDVDGALQARR